MLIKFISYLFLSIYCYSCIWPVLQHSIVVNAFIPDRLLGVSGPLGRFHTTITESALAKIAYQYFGDILENNNKTIKGKAPKNDADLSPLFEAIYGDSIGAVYYKNALSKIKDGVADVDYNLETRKNPFFHFDAERIVDANQKIVGNLKLVLTLLEQGDLDAARFKFGINLHILQDFYAHSNWIELNETEPNFAIGVPGREGELGEIAAPDQETCHDCNASFTTVHHTNLYRAFAVGGQLVDDFLKGGSIGNVFECNNNIMKRLKNAITSGYVTNGKDDQGNPIEKPENVGKCSHGGLVDSSSTKKARGGINKDSSNILLSPHHDLHMQAANMAENATVYWVDQVRKSLNNDTVFGQFLGLIQGTTMAFVIDITRSARSEQYAKNVIRKITAKVDQFGDHQDWIRPQWFILITYDGETVNEPMKINNLGLFFHVLDGLTIEPLANGDKAAGSSEKLFGALELASQESWVGGHIFSLSANEDNSKQNVIPKAASYQRLKENIHRKYLWLDAFVINDSPQGKRHRRNSVDNNHNSDVINHDNNMMTSSLLLQEIVQRSGGNLYLVTSNKTVNKPAPLYRNVRGIKDRTEGNSQLPPIIENGIGINIDGLGHFELTSKLQPTTVLFKYKYHRSSIGQNDQQQHFYVDDTVSKFTVHITSNIGQRVPYSKVIVMDPNKNQAVATETIEKSDTVSIESYTADNKGIWAILVNVDLESSVTFSIEIRAQSTLLLDDVKFYQVFNSIEYIHPGSIETQSTPIIGTSFFVEASLVNQNNTLVNSSNYRIELLDPTNLNRNYGQFIIMDTSDTSNSEITNQQVNLLAKIDKIPAAPFIIAVTGCNEQGDPTLRRIKPEIIVPSYITLDVNKKGTTDATNLKNSGQGLQLSANITNTAPTPALLSISVKDSKKLVKQFAPEGALLIPGQSVQVSIKLIANDDNEVKRGTVTDLHIVAIGNTELFSNVYYEQIIFQ